MVQVNGWVRLQQGRGLPRKREERGHFVPEALLLVSGVQIASGTASRAKRAKKIFEALFLVSGVQIAPGP